jgi:aryl-alcohol dehydrogenase-like predicted oxidoreductase
VSEQPPYSLLVRGIEADVLPVAEQYGLMGIDRRAVEGVIAAIEGC